MKLDHFPEQVGVHKYEQREKFRTFDKTSVLQWPGHGCDDNDDDVDDNDDDEE